MFGKHPKRTIKSSYSLEPSLGAFEGFAFGKFTMLMTTYPGKQMFRVGYPGIGLHRCIRGLGVGNQILPDTNCVAHRLQAYWEFPGSLLQSI
jgi:hypothetical protein